MANIKLPKAEFEKHIKLTDEIKEKISMFGTPLESISDDEIEIEIFPNRPDLLSFHGYLRAFLGFLGKTKGMKKYNIKKSGYELIVEKSLPKQWPYAFACIVKGLKFDDEKIKEIIQIQEKLGATLLRNRKKGGIGVYPLEKLSFPIKFTGMKPDEIKFRPLEYPAQITGRQILSKHPTGREYAHICKDWEKFPVFVDKNGVMMSMPPIINSHDVGKIDESTKDVFVEVTGNDFINTQKALIIMVTALADMGGQIYSIDCTQQNKKKTAIPDLTSEKMKISVENTNKLLGLNLTEKQIKNCLEKMGYDYHKGEVEIPAWRTDILHENDLIEDVAIAYGYENFEPEIPNVQSVGEVNEIEIKKRKLANLFLGLNMLEISSYHLTTIRDQFKKMNVKKQNIIEVEDSKTEYNILRNNLMHYALKTFGENINAEYPQRIFEFGKIFEKDKDEIAEKEKLCIAVADSKANFTNLKQILDYLMRMLGKSYEIKQTEHQSFIPGRCGEIIMQDKPIGIIGEIKPSVLKNWHIKMPVSLIEIDMGEF